MGNVKITEEYILWECKKEHIYMNLINISSLLYTVQRLLANLGKTLLSWVNTSVFLPCFNNL